MSLRYALIGCGRIATNHVKAVLKNELAFVAVCDVIPEKMEQLLAQYDLEKDESIHRYTDYQEMIRTEKPDLVAIATESGAHARIALDCIHAGIHTIIEKPIAMSIADADAIVKASQECDVVVSVCHQNRFNIAVQKTKKAMEEGRFGKLSHGSIHVRWNRNENYYKQASWRGTWEHDGGFLINQCIHGIDLLRWLMGGDLVSVYGATRKQQHDYLETEDVGMAVLTFKSGAIATVEGTTNVYPENLEEVLYLFGENGTVKIGGKNTNNLDVWQFASTDPEDEANAGLKEASANVYGNGHTGLYADVADAIRNHRKPFITALDGRNALEVVLAIYKSQKTGLPVNLPLTDFASTDMAGEFE